MIDDIPVLKELVRNREALLRDCMQERDALRAELAAMQEWKELAKQYKTELDAMRQQEPVAWRWLYDGKPDSERCFEGTGPDPDVELRALSAEFPRTVQRLCLAPEAQG